MKKYLKSIAVLSAILVVGGVMMVGNAASAASFGYDDDWGDLGSSGYNDGWGDYSSGYDDGWGDVSSYGYNDGWGDVSAPFEEEYVHPYSYEESYEYPYVYDYDDYGYDDYSYDYGCGSLCGGGYSSYDYGCGSSCYNYTTPGCSFCGGTSYSPPRYSPPVISQPAHSSSSYYSNTNTNTNVNNITNIDNSINDSFNNYNSNNTSLVVATPQYPVVYTAPAAPYCTINNAASSNYGNYNYGSQSYLSWSSTNATSAYLTNVGSVATNGSQVVYPQMTTTYTLTVYGQNGQSANCSTTVYANNFIPPVVQQPYVALTQIPYTGFDFGPIGNAIYWASLFSFAAAGAYLMIYFRGGALSFATNMIGMKRQQQLLPAIVAPQAPLSN